MLKTLAVLAALAVIAPGLAVADGNQPNTPGPPTVPGPFANDPPLNTFNNPSILPAGLGPTTFPVPGCNVGDPDDAHNPSNGDDKRATTGNPHCQPASP
jgi:hypothetical protein